MLRISFLYLILKYTFFTSKSFHKTIPQMETPDKHRQKRRITLVGLPVFVVLPSLIIYRVKIQPRTNNMQMKYLPLIFTGN